MNSQMETLITLFPKNKKTISVSEIAQLCLDNEDLPKNKSDIYFLISLLVSVKKIKKIKKGTYEILGRV